MQASSSAGAALEIESVRKVYLGRSGAAVEALAGISFDVKQREVVAVVGPSGCGKTSLLEIVCGLAEPASGTVRAEPAVLMPQRDLLMPWMTALDNAALALRIAGAARDEARSQAQPLFERLGLGGFEEARPRELSSGMRQRVAFARTLLSGRPVLCLDEPFGALDALTRADLQAWLAGALAAEPRTTLLVTHDVEEAAIVADRVVVLSPRPGRVVAELPVTAARPRAVTDAVVLETRVRALAALR